MHRMQVLSLPSLWLLAIVLTLFVVGSGMVFDTSSAEILDKGASKSIYAPFLKQWLSGAVALGCGWVAYRMPYQRIVERAPLLLGGLMVLLLLVLIPGIGVIANGSRRWLSLAGFSFQPSEFVKIAAPLYLIYYVQKNREVWTLWRLCRALWPIVVAMALIIVEPDNRTTAIIGMTTVVAMLLLRIPARFWALPIACIAIVAAISAYHVPYVMKRLNVYLHPEADLQGKGHQPYQAKIALGSGGLWGKGWGESLQKLTYLPEAQNDYIVAIFAEERGFVGMVLLILSYLAIIGIGFGVALRIEEGTGAVLLSMMTFLIGFQAFVNFAVVSGLLPSTGLNLPFFSQGGTSLSANAFALGVILNIAERHRHAI